MSLFSMANAENEVDSAEEEWIVLSSSIIRVFCICLTGCCGFLPFMNVLSMNTNSCSVLDMSESTDELSSLILYVCTIAEREERNEHLKA